jgi:5-methylcytosine-specific restriction endonuclease McrA
MSAKRIICKDTGEVVKKYFDYLGTTHWKALRQKIASSYDFKCNDCGADVSKGYEIHHLTYKNVGNEKDKDLVCLCRNCHQKRTEETIKIKEQNVKLKGCKLSERLKYTREMKKKINIVLHSRKSVVSLFKKHFDRFIIDLEKLEKKEGK